MAHPGPSSSRLDEFIANPRAALWRLAAPVAIGMSIQTFYMLADLYFVGRFSSEALAALAFNMPVVFMGIGIVFGLGAGVTSVIARAIGARDKRRADSSAEHAVALGLVVSAAFTAGAYLFGESMLRALGVPDNLMAFAWGYLRILASGYVFLVMSVFFRSILTGEGDTRTPVMIQGLGTLLNIALDPVFIFTFGLGVEGAAMATVISQALAALAFVYLLFFRSHTYVTFDLADFRYEREILTSIFRVGAPASFSFVVMATGGAFYNRLLVEYSEATVAAFQVGSRIDHIFLLPVIATAAGIMTLVGMFQGAERHDLTRGVVRYAMTRSLGLSVIMGAVFYVGAPAMMGVFTESTAIASAGVGYLRVAVFAYPFVVVVMLTGRILQGMGQGSPVLILSVLRVVLLSGPFAFAFVFWMGKPVEWIWWAIVGGMAGTAVIAMLWLRRELTRSEDVNVPGVTAPEGALG